MPDTTFIKEGRTATAAREHVAILDAIRSRDAEAAETAAILHIKAALEVRLAISNPGS